MSLSGLTKQLQRLQRLCAQPSSSAMIELEEAPAFCVAASQALQAGIVGSAADQAAALRTLNSFSACLPQLGARLLAIPDQRVFVARVSAFTFVVHGTLILAREAGMASLPVAVLAGQLAQVLLRCGTESLQRRPPLPPEVALSLLSGLLHGLIQAFAMARLATADDSQAAFLARAPPALMATFLRATVAACAAIPAHMHAPGSLYASSLTLLSDLLFNVVPIYNTPALQPHSLADAQLLLPLVELLTPGAAALAVSLQLPPERRPEGSSWPRAVSSSAVVSALGAAIPGELAAQVAGGIGRAAQLLPACARLLLHVPLPALAAEDEPPGQRTSWRNIQSLAESLTLAAEVECCALEQPADHSRRAGPTSRQPSHTALLLQLVPRLASILKALAADAQEGVLEADQGAAALHSLARSVTHLAQLLQRVLQQPERGSGAPPAMERVLTLGGAAVHTMDLLAWLAAATDAVLPGQQTSQAQASAATAATQCSQLAGTIVGQLAWEAHNLPAGAIPAGEVQHGVPAALHALWALHTACCRLMHCAQELEPTAAMLLPATLYATHAVVTAAGQGCRSLHSRQLQAMSCAHLEAIRACLPALADICRMGGNGAAQQKGATNLAVSLGLAAAWGPASVATSPELQTMFVQLAELLPPASLRDAFLYDVVCREARTSAPVAALLLASGLVGGPGRVEPTERGMQAAGQRDLQLAIDTVEPALLEAADQAAAAGLLPTATTSEQQLASEVHEAATAARAALGAGRCAADMKATSACPAERVLPAARQLADALLAWWRRPEQQAEAAIEAAQAAAARSCAYLHCANLVAEGGPAAGQGEGSMRCSACRAVWYCGTACSHADWREGGHRRLCKALGAARQAAKQRAAEAAGEQ